MVLKNLVPEIKLKFEPRDIWIGVYWEYDNSVILTNRLTVYVCILPFLPIRLRWIFFSQMWHDYQHNENERKKLV